MNRKTVLFTLSLSLLTGMLTFLTLPSRAQGKVLINEYLPWPNNACGVTAEFIELLNFGPGPMNIGCYIITDGDFSITIPPNTILQPGQFYVLAGQNTIPQNCGNDLRNVTVNLNWATCGCTSGSIPVTGDGLMTDGGSGNEQIVLLDPNLKIIDAVVRGFPVEPSSAITTSSMGGQCTSKTFDLDTMNVQYETIGESTGRGNSMAREIDGGCRWIKDTQESAGDPNNTPSSGYVIDASLTVTEPVTCSNTGEARISVLSGNMSQLFPMRYMLAFDADSNNIYNFLDTYTNGIDSTASTIPLTGLTWGNYQVVISTEKDCDLTPFNFVILNCIDVILPQLFTHFKATTNNTSIQLVWNVADRELIRSFEIEESKDGQGFYRIGSLTNTRDVIYRNHFSFSTPLKTTATYYRVRLITTTGQTIYSTVAKALLKEGGNAVRVFPNPVINTFTARITVMQRGEAQVIVSDKLGTVIQRYRIFLQQGANTISLPADNFPAGIYSLSIQQNQTKPGTTVKIIKAK